MDDELTHAGAAITAVGLVAVGLWWWLHRRGTSLARIEAARHRLGQIVARDFLVEPCGRCLEAEMELLGVSPAGRTVQYRCAYCGKRTRSPAGSPRAAPAAELWAGLTAQVAAYNAAAPAEPVVTGVRFATPAAPLPFELTTRTPIPPAVRSEVWRRDNGQCVGCGTKQNLQFDHIIPVAQGGATTAANLQVLCRACNLAKGAHI